MRTPRDPEKPKRVLTGTFMYLVLAFTAGLIILGGCPPREVGELGNEDKPPWTEREVQALCDEMERTGPNPYPFYSWIWDRQVQELPVILACLHARTMPQ